MQYLQHITALERWSLRTWMRKHRDELHLSWFSVMLICSVVLLIKAGL